jgi:hypothetical protein
LPECASCGRNRRKVHRTTMIDNRSKAPERIEVPLCGACIDYLVARTEHLGS